MKLRSFRLALLVAVAGVYPGLFAQDQPAYAEISLAGPGKGTKTINRSEYIVLVVEGPALSFESTAIPYSQVVEYVNEQLKTHKVAYIGLYVREGTKYGELIRAIDLLRKTNAKNIGVSISELPPGYEPK